MLAVLVVFIHNNFTEESVAETFAETGRVIAFNQSAFGAWVQLFVSQGIARCAVPLFFLFAAFLQAKKSDPYPTLLKKKAKSLLLPYALWMFAFFFYFNILKLLVAKIAPQVLGMPDLIPMFDWTPADWVHQFLGYNQERGLDNSGGTIGTPELSVQFWFVRDLLILTILSPAIIALIKKFPAGIFAFISAIFLLDGRVYFVVTQALFFYVAGLYWGLYEIPLLEKIDRIKWSEAVFLFLAAFFCGQFFYDGSGTCFWIMVLAACVVLLKFSKVIAQNEKLFALAKRLSVYSFFVFAIHIFLLSVIQRFWLKLFPMTNTFFCLFEYFGVTLLAVALAVGIGALLRKICPPLFSLLNGGRG